MQAYADPGSMETLGVIMIVSELTAQAGSRHAPQITHAPERKCANFPLCGHTQARPKVNGKRTPGNGFCAECNGRGICVHPGCQHPFPAGRYKAGDKRKKNPTSPHGLCTLHIDDPCYEHLRDIWTPCSRKDVGCRQLSLRCGGGLCYAAPQICHFHFWEIWIFRKNILICFGSFSQLITFSVSAVASS